MFDFSPSLESPIKSESKTIIIDFKQFPVCVTKLTEIKGSGIKKFKKPEKLVYAHHDGKELHVTIVDLETNEIIRKS